MSHFQGPIDGRVVVPGTYTAAGGTTNFHIGYPPGQDGSARKLEPFSAVPFAPDSDFVPRPKILEWIRDKCTGSGARAALVVLGGVGKSQLAIRYAYDVRDALPQTFVFWVHASNKARFEEAYRVIADRLALPRRHDPNVDILRLVSDWLCDETNGQWRMIVDNADDVNVFFPSRNGRPDEPSRSLSASLAAYLPQSRNGSILITSRNRDAAARLAGGYTKIKEVLTMDESEGHQLLRNKLGDTSLGEGAAELLRALDYMPLAITQAAAYIHRRANITALGYVKEFRANDKKKENLLNWDAGDLRRDESASNSVVTTWQISFERIQEERPSAADLLSLISFFNSQGIPEWILRRYSRSVAKTSDEEEANSAFDEDFDTLRAYSLIATTVETDMCETHALVQFCTQVWLTRFGNIEWWKGKFMELIAKEFPFVDFKNWAKCQQLLPHVASLYASEPSSGKAVRDWARVLNNAARYTQTRLGKYSEAETLNRRALEGREKELGVQHPDTLTSVSNLAGVLQDQGKYSEAETLNRRALEGREKELGVQHPDTLTSVNNLALVLRYQGKYSEAETLNRRALEGSEKELGVQHPNTLSSVNNLALVLRDQGKYTEAKTLNRRALEGCEKELGVQHPNTLTSVSNLAGVLQDQGKYSEAETLNRRALEGSEKELGVQHPNTLTSVYCLAYLLHKCRRYEEASQLYQRASSGYSEKLGSQHPTAVACRNDLKAMQREAEEEREGHK